LGTLSIRFVASGIAIFSVRILLPLLKGFL